ADVLQTCCRPRPRAICRATQVRTGDRWLSSWMHFPHPHEPLRLWVRQRPQQDAVHDREHCGSAADASRDREEERPGEATTLRQEPERLLDVASECVHVPPDARV